MQQVSLSRPELTCRDDGIRRSELQFFRGVSNRLTVPSFPESKMIRGKGRGDGGGGWNPEVPKVQGMS